MDCRAFEANIDRYLDVVLSGPDMKTAAEHVRGCEGCNKLVTSYQHASALLRTAVADKAAAVDVSGLWKSIEARLEAEPGTLALARPELSGAKVGKVGWARQLDRARDLVLAILGPAPLRAGVFAAAAVVLALFVLAGSTDIGTKFGHAIARKKVGAPTIISRHDDLRTRDVSIDNVDIAAGSSVSIWSRPRTRTQVIWVNDPGDEFGVGNIAATDSTR